MIKAKDIPPKILKRIKYVRGEGYKIIGKDGKLSPETYYSQLGAASMLSGTSRSRAFDPELP